MPITEKEREQRRKHIGSSDIATILGINPYSSAYDLWHEKTNQLNESKGNKQTDAGNIFESAVLDYAEQEYGKLLRNQKRRAPMFTKNLPIVANIDALIISTSRPIDAKTSGLFGRIADGWGEPGTDEVPEPIIVQAQTHILCAQSDICYIVAFLGGRGFCRYVIKRNDKLIASMLEEAEKFWSCVLNACPPPNTEPTMRSIKRLIREPNKIVNIPSDIVTVWYRAKKLLSTAKSFETKAQKAVLAALGDAEVGQSEVGTVTYKEQTRKAYHAAEAHFRVARLSNYKELPAAEETKTLEQGDK